MADNAETAGTGTSRGGWTFLTNHGHVLVCIATDPEVRGRDIAARVGITERAAQTIITDLVSEGYVTRTRVGRRNRYRVNPDTPLRHPCEQPHSIGELLRLVAPRYDSPGPGAGGASPGAGPGVGGASPGPGPGPGPGAGAGAGAGPDRVAGPGRAGTPARRD